MITIDVKVELCMKVNGRRYGSPKTAAMAIARLMGENLLRKWMHKHYDEYGRPTGNESMWSYRNRMSKRAYRRIKDRIKKAFGDYVVA